MNYINLRIIDKINESKIKQHLVGACACLNTVNIYDIYLCY
jgi:hypothetical protein